MTEEIGKEPRYPLVEASLLTGVPKQTLRTWFLGWKGGKGRTPQPPVLQPDQAAVDPLTLSFFNIVEARFLAAYRNLGVPMQRVRLALDYVNSRLPGVPRPLLSHTFETDGRALFVDLVHQGTGRELLVEVSANGQQVWPELVRAHFKSIGFDPRTGHPAQIWLDAEHKIVVDPAVGWGMPAIAQTGLRTEIIFERFDAGEDVEEISEDFSINAHTVQEAIRWEQQARHAA